MTKPKFQEKTIKVVQDTCAEASRVCLKMTDDPQRLAYLVGIASVYIKLSGQWRKFIEFRQDFHLGKFPDGKGGHE